MGVMPDKQAEKIEWCEQRVATWIANALVIGTTAAEATAFETKTEAARAALTAAEGARVTAKNATATLHNALAALDIAAAGIIKQVRAKAETTNNPEVYVLASIPAPVTPGPVGAPGLPEGLKATILPNGTLELTWKCSNPAGCHSVIYQVYRKVESTGEYHYLGGSGERKFTDVSLPAGAPSVMYQIQGTRSTSVGLAAEFIVNFGVTGTTGTMTASVTSAQPAKIAA